MIYYNGIIFFFGFQGVILVVNYMFFQPKIFIRLIFELSISNPCKYLMLNY